MHVYMIQTAAGPTGIVDAGKVVQVHEATAKSLKESGAARDATKEEIANPKLAAEWTLPEVGSHHRKDS